MPKVRDGLSVGDKVTITLSGTFKVATLRDHSSCVEVVDEQGWTHYVFPESGLVKFNMVKKNFRPNVGDVYRIGNSNWIAVNTGYGTSVTGMTSQAGVHFSLEQFIEEYPEAKKVYPV